MHRCTGDPSEDPDMKIRSGLYKTGTALGNLNAVRTGRVPQRVARVAAGRAYSRAMRASGCLLPVLALLALAAYLTGGLL